MDNVSPMCCYICCSRRGMYWYQPSDPRNVNLKLRFQISTIAFSVYEAKWIGDISPRLRLGSLIIAHRAQRGAEIKAGGLINVNVQNFGSVSIRNI